MLKQLEESDLSLIREWRNEEKVRQAMFTGHIISESEHLSWWGNIRKDKTKQWFIYYHQGKKSGVVYYTDLDKEEISWGFYLSNNLETKKLRIQVWKNLEKQAIEYGFRVLKSKKMTASVFEFNKAVIKMHQRFGFEINDKKSLCYNNVIIMSLVFDGVLE